MQGAPPLASLAFNRLRHLQSLPLLYPAGACPAGHPPDLAAAIPSGGLTFFVACCPLPLACFPAPIPPLPLPRRGRGRPRLFHARGSAPCIPGLNPNGAGSRGEPLTRRGRARLVAGSTCRLCTQRGRALFCRLPSLPSACFIAPYPPNPLPRRGRGRPRLFHARGSAPCIPGAEPKRRWEQGRTTHPAGACPAGRRLTLPPLCPAGGLPALSPVTPCL